MASTAAAKPNLAVDTSLAASQGRHPRQANRAMTHAARSATAPRDELSQGGFSSDDEPQQSGQQQSQQPRRTLVRQRSNDPADDSSDEEGQGNYTHHAQAAHHGEAGIHQGIDDDEEEDEEEYDDEEDEDDLDDEDDDLSSSPSIPDENIDFDLVYALHTFVATVEGQATVNKGNSLTLLDDSNSYWWLVRVLRTQEVGYIPAENIETPFERLARLNKHRNVDLASATDDDHIQVPSKIYSSHLVKQRDATGPEGGMSVHSGKLSALSRRRDGASPQNVSPGLGPTSKPSVVFGPSSYVEHSGDEMDSEYDEDMEDGEYEEDEDEEGEGEEGDERDMDEDEVRDQLEQSEPDVRSRGSSAAQQQQIQGNVDTAAGRREMLAGMDPDDGMDWDAKEAERIQSQKKAATAAAAAAAATASGVGAAGSRGAEPQRGLYRDQSQQGQDSQGRAPGTSWDNMAMGDGSQPRDQSQLGYGRPGQQGQPQQQNRASYGSQQDSQLRRPSAERTFSNESRESGRASSDGGFLPSQVQRDRAVSDASVASSSGSLAGNNYAAGGGPYGRGSPTPQQLRKEKEQRRKSKQSSLDVMDDSTASAASDGKEGKKRSGVFSGLFSRNKDKKDRKSGSFSSAGDESAILGGRPSEEGGRAGNVRMSTGGAGTTGMGRGVQEKDRLTQEAYQRQFLSSDRSSMEPGQGQFISRPGGGKARPGSLMGTPNSVPMLNVLRIFAGDDIGADSTFKTVLLNDSTSAKDLVRQAMQRFRLGYGEYVLSVKLLEGSERLLRPDEKPLQVFDRLSEMAPDGAMIPSVKRSSVGSISSIASNLSLNPAIARVNEDFSDDHAVKFYLKRAPSPGGRAGVGSAAAGGLQPGQVWSSSNAYADDSLDSNASRGPLKIPGGLSPIGTPLAEGPDMLSQQSPQARFALRLVIFPGDLPEGLSFDPQTNALIPDAILAERGPSANVPAEGIEQRFREKVLSLPRNATVAEVVEAGLDRFGIADGLVEGGDDVEERTSRRRSRPRVRYSLTVDVKRQGPGKERHLQPNSRVLEAYPTPPVFKTSPANKRRSNDSAMLLNMAEDQIRREDPVFVLRAVTGPGASGAKAPPGKSVRSLSPTEGVLAERHEQRRQSQLDAIKAPANGSEPTTPTSATAPAASQRSREVIAAQRAAAQERKAAVLGAQRNDQQGVDLYLVNDGKIRSSRLLEGGRVRYSYLPTAGGQEMDISAIVEDVLTIDATPQTSSTDTVAGGRLGDGGLRPSIPERGASTSTLTSQYMDAPSSPLPEQQDGRSSSAAANRDLLETFVRNPATDEDTIEARIDQVLSRVADANASTGGSMTGRSAPPAPTRSTSRPGVQHRKQGSMGGVGGNAPDGTSDFSYGSVYDSSPRSASTATDKSAATTNPTPISTVTAAAAAGGAGAGALATGSLAAAGAGAAIVGGAAVAGAALAAGGGGSNNSNAAANTTSNTSASSPRRRIANGGPAAFIPRDDFGLDHLYTLVDAAARRDPKKYVTRVVSRSASRAGAAGNSSRDSGMGMGATGGVGGVGAPSPPASRHNSVVAVRTYAPQREMPRAQVAGLFPPPASQMPSGLARSGAGAGAGEAAGGAAGGAGGDVGPGAGSSKQQKLVHQAYLPLEKHLDRIEEGLDALLEQALKAF